MFVHGSLVASGTDEQRIILTATVPTVSEDSPFFSWLGVEWMPGAKTETETVDFIEI